MCILFCFLIKYVLGYLKAEPNRDNVLYMEMNRRYETQNVIDMFSEFGQIFVSWIDDSSALIYLKEEKNFKKGEKIKNNFHSNFQVLLDFFWANFMTQII